MKQEKPPIVIRTCALYARVSTNNGTQDPEMQLRELREYAQQRGWKTIEYVDHLSGAKESRPQLNQLMADAKAKKFQAVLVWKLDRFGRSLAHLVNALALFEKLEITFVSKQENLDPTTPMGKAMFGMIGVMAEFERSLIQERVKAGLRNAKAKGRLLGRKKGAISKNARSRTTLWRRKRAAAAAATVGNENSVTPTVGQ